MMSTDALAVLRSTRRSTLLRWPAAILTAAASLALAGCGVVGHQASHTVSYGAVGPESGLIGTMDLEADESAEFDSSFDVGMVTDLDVSTRNGKITVTVDPEIESMLITATFKAKSTDAASANARVRAASIDLDELGDGKIRLAPEMPGGWKNGDGASFDIRVPGPTALNARTSNGRVTANGPVGPITVATSNGRITLDGTLGAASLSTSNGRVTVVDHLGPLQATTSNGAMDIRLHDESSESVTLRTSNGAVSLVVGQAFGGDLTATTSNGSMSVDGFAGTLDDVKIERRRAHIVMPGKASSTVRTSNGSVKLTRRAAATAGSGSSAG
ncbi:MAG: DUF4097 domain-containing protein [Phycisphaerales bacterium]